MGDVSTSMSGNETKSKPCVDEIAKRHGLARASELKPKPRRKETADEVEASLAGDRARKPDRQARPADNSIETKGGIDLPQGLELAVVGAKGVDVVTGRNMSKRLKAAAAELDLVQISIVASVDPMPGTGLFETFIQPTTNHANTLKQRQINSGFQERQIVMRGWVEGRTNVEAVKDLAFEALGRMDGVEKGPFGASWGVPDTGLAERAVIDALTELGVGVFGDTGYWDRLEEVARKHDAQRMPAAFGRWA